MASPEQSTNFGFLAEHDSLFVELALSAERAFASDPNTTLIKLRQLGEALAQHIAALAGVTFDEQTTQADLLYKISYELKLEPVVRELFHTLRVEGNKATHQFKTQHKEAISGLVVARNSLSGFISVLVKQAANLNPAPSFPRQTQVSNCASCKPKSPNSKTICSRPTWIWAPASNSMN